MTTSANGWRARRIDSEPVGRVLALSMLEAEGDDARRTRRSKIGGVTRSVTALRMWTALLALGCGAAWLAACGGEENPTQKPTANPPIAMTVVNQMPLPAPCMGDSLTFFEGTTPVDIAYQSQKTVQVAELFGAYQIGFQV